jgi:DNA-binding response OmpR family regulator
MTSAAQIHPAHIPAAQIQAAQIQAAQIHQLRPRPVAVDRDAALLDAVATLLARALTPDELHVLVDRLAPPTDAAGAAPPLGEQHLVAGTLDLDLASMRVQVGGAPIDLTRQEFLLLHTLMEHPARVLSRVQLLSLAWDYRGWGEGRTVDVHVRRLRAKLGAEARRVETVRGFGYRFDPA